MRAVKKTARAMEKFLAQAASAGYDMSRFAEKKQEVVREVEVASTRQLPKYYEAEGVLLCLEKPSRFMFKTCKRTECQEPFGTNYKSVAYCSDNCRSKDLEKIGIHWDPTKTPEERWGGEPPLLIPPAAVKMLIQRLSSLLESDVLSALQKLEFEDPVHPSPPDQDKTTVPVLPSPKSPIKWNTGETVFGF